MQEFTRAFESLKILEIVIAASKRLSEFISEAIFEISDFNYVAMSPWPLNASRS